MTTPPRRRALRELALLFLRLGTTAFGGPAAHIALMEEEVVRRRGWISREEFVDLLGAVNLIPGPNSTELAIHLGHRRAGFPGLVVAGACFILPAALMVAAIGWAYQRMGHLPAFAGVLLGVKPVVLAVVLQALIGFGRTALRAPRAWLVALVSLAAAAAGVHELVVLLGAGSAAVLLRLGRRRSAAAVGLAGFVAPAGAATAAAAVTATPAAVFLVFARIGSVLFGSGYVLLAFLRADLVQRLGWLTESQLLDAIAVGQVTPGPVFTTATFVGYLVGGGAGAVAATLGIFLPAFFFVAVSGPLVPRLRRSPIAGALLDGVNWASLALMALVTAELGAGALREPLGILLFVAAAVLLLRFKVSSSWLVLAGAAIGALRAWWA